MRTAPGQIRRLTLLVAAAAGLSCSLAFGQPGMARRGMGQTSLVEPAKPEQIAGWIAELGTGSASDSSRLEAARSLIRHSPDSGVFPAIEAAIAPPLAGVSGGRYILSAIDEAPTPPPVLAAVITRRAAVADESELPRLLRTLGFFRSRDAARTLIGYTKHSSPVVAQAAFESLEALSGNKRIARSPDAWAVWLAEADALDELGWSRKLLEAISQAQRTAEAREAATKSRLVETLRKLHIETPPEKRSELLASMLRDTDPDVQRVGFDLARRDLSVNGSLDNSVGDAAIELLNSPSPALRSDAAVLVRQLGPDAGEKAVLAALAIETDPSVAANLLIASARWPRAETLPAVLKWMSEPACRSAAAEAAWALVRTASVSDSDRKRIFESVTAVPSAGLSAAEIQLIGALGSTEDLIKLQPLLDSTSGTVQRAAADALLWDTDTFRSVLEAAARHPNLFESATTAVLIHDATLEGFQVAMQLPAASDELRRDRLAGLTRGMVATDVLAASDLVDDPELRRSLLVAMTSDARIAAERDRPEALAAISEAIVRQTEDDIAALRHDAGLSRFELFPFVFDSEAGPRASALRCCCLVALGRLTTAVDLACDLKSWLRGLEGASGRPHELSVVEMIEADFGEQLDDSARETLRAIRNRVAADASPR